jgi:hypothetical protein
MPIFKQVRPVDQVNVAKPMKYASSILFSKQSVEHDAQLATALDHH